MPEPSDNLMELVYEAFDHAFRSIEGGGTLIAFSLGEWNGEVRLLRFASETFEQGVADGREQLASCGADRATLAWDGFITSEEGRFDAIFVEGQDRWDGPESFRFVMRYKPGGRFVKRRPTPIDDRPVLIEQGRDLIGG